MESKSGKGKKISRRGILSIFGGGLLIPFLGFGNSTDDDQISNNDEEYQTLLKPDGTTVKVKVSKIQTSKVVNKNISNKSFLKWLDKK
jgi:hypothetical protein